MDVMESIKNTYTFLFYDLADPRTNDWFMTTHPVVFPIVGIYLYIVLKCIPKFMENRKPLEFKNTLIVYNFIQVLLSIYIVWLGVANEWFTKTNFRCDPVDASNDPRALMVARGCWIYYMAKYSELLDTVFFALRKKNNQITFLHLYHHSVMPLISWGCTKYYPGGHGTFIGMINSMVHIVMYFYYMMAAMGPKYQRYLWWKKYITTLQLLQFCIAFLHSMQLLFYDCGYPRWTTLFTLPNAIFFYYLFSDFYNKAYPDAKKNKQQKGKKEVAAALESKSANGIGNGKLADTIYKEAVLNGELAKKTM